MAEEQKQAALAQTQSIATNASTGGIKASSTEISSDPNASSPIDTSATQQIGRYQLLRKLGQGGFGEVYEAHDPQLHRTVAIKLPRERLRANGKATELYVTEARALARLTHSNIVAIYDVGQTESIPCYLVSQYIEGSSLTASKVIDGQDIRTAVRIVAEIADALHYAHKQGIFHRDIKPDNILIDSSGKAYLTDFGIAITEDAVGTGPRIVGTGYYMSPEQINCQSHLVDGRSDIYSLGVVLYELLTSKRPFQASEMHVLQEQIVSVSPRPLRSIRDDVPIWLEQVCLKAMAKRREDRYSTAQEFGAALQRGLSDADRKASPNVSSSSSPITLPKQTPRWVLPLVALLSVVAVSPMLMMFLRNKSGSPGGDNSLVSNVPPIETASSSSVPQSSTAQVTRFDIKVWGEGRSGESIEQAMPIRIGDSVTLEVELSRPAYVLLAWIDTEGKSMELFPSDPSKGLRTDGMVSSLRSPEEFQRGWPVVGPAGMETVVLLVSDEPLAGKSQLLERLQLPRADRYNSVKEMVHYSVSKQDQLAAVGSSKYRGLGKESVSIDQPVLALLDSLKPDFEAIRAIRIAHE